MVYLLAVLAAISNALTSVLQRMGVEDAPKNSTLKLSLLTHALRRGVWLLGFAVMILSFVFQAIALHLGSLAQVQPILTIELVFLMVILMLWFRFRVGWREWTGAVAASAGLAGFLVFASPASGNQTPDVGDWLAVGLSCGGVVVVACALALRGPRWWRAAMFGLAAAVGFAFTAALTKVVTAYIAVDWTTVFVHWQTYALAACGVLSVFLAQNAYHSGPIAASQSTLVLADPLASILIGVALFGDQLRTAEPWGPLEALSLLVMFGGALTLCHSPLISGMTADGTEELLSLRSRSTRLANAVSPGPAPS